MQIGVPSKQQVDSKHGCHAVMPCRIENVTRHYHKSTGERNMTGNTLNAAYRTQANQAVMACKTENITRRHYKSTGEQNMDCT